MSIDNAVLDRTQIMRTQEIPCVQELRILGALGGRSAPACSIVVNMRSESVDWVVEIAERLVAHGILTAKNGAHSDDPEVGKYYVIADQYRGWFGPRRGKLLEAMRAQYPDAFQVDPKIGKWLEPELYY